MVVVTIAVKEFKKVISAPTPQPIYVACTQTCDHAHISHAIVRMRKTDGGSGHGNANHLKRNP